MTSAEIFRPVFLCVLLAGTALPLVAVLTERLFLRTASASARHRLWSLTAVGLLLFPGLVLLVRGNSERPAVPIVAESVIPEPVASENHPTTPAIPFLDVAERHPESSATENFVPEESAPRFTAKTQAEPGPFAKIDFGAAATRVWLLGAVLFLLHYLGVRVRSFFALLPLRFAKTFDAESVAGIRLIRSEKTTIPFAFGMLRPVIVFPVAAAHWPNEKIRAVLQHERAHIVRRDLFWQNVVHVARALYWFHPLVWFLARRVRIEQELACDDMVLQSGQRNSDYAEVLLDLSKNLSFQERIPTGGLAMVRQKTVVKRIDSILDEKTSRQPIGRKGTLGILLGLGLLSLAVSLFAPRIPLPGFSVPKTEEFRLGEERKIEIQGRVWMPDGSPAPESLLKTSQTSGWADIISINPSNKTGEYTDKVHVGAYYIAFVSNSLKLGGPSDNFASSVVATVVTDPPKPGQFDIRLQEGIRVHGSILYESGEPAAGKNISFSVYPFGKESITLRRKSSSSSAGSSSSSSEVVASLDFNVTSDEKGHFNKILLPGEYVVSTPDQFGDSRTIVLKPDEKEFRLDFVLSDPTEGQVFMPDGSPAANLEIRTKRVRSTGNNLVSSESLLNTDAEGRFRINLSPQANMLQLATKDGKYGLIRYLEGDERNEPLKLILQPAATGKVRIISAATGKPIAGHSLQYAPKLAAKHDPPKFYVGGDSVQTKSDSEGWVVLDRLYVGGRYELEFELPQGAETYPYFQCKFTPTEPGELIDLGERRVNGDFKAYENANPKAEELRPGEERKIEIRGRILMPDGSPAPESLLKTSCASDLGIALSSYYSDKNGGYKGKGFVGSYYLACVNNPGGPSDNLASSVVATVITDPPTPGQFDIQLREGIRVHGSLLYENGKPASEKTVFFKVYPFKELSTVPEKDKLNDGLGLGLSFSAKSDKKGGFSKALLPGEYFVSMDGQFGSDGKKTIVLKPDEKEFRLDLTLPNPTEGQVFMPDGSPAANLEIATVRGLTRGNHSDTSEDQFKTDAEGRFRANFSPQSNMLQLATADGKYGLVRYLEGEERNEPLKLVLQPAATGKVRIISAATGKPIAGHPLLYAPRLEVKSEPPRSFAGGYSVQTKSDSEGWVVLDRLYVDGRYELGFELPQGAETYPYLQCEFTPTQPGELIDLGERRVDGDFKAYEKNIQSGIQLRFVDPDGKPIPKGYAQTYVIASQDDWKDGSKKRNFENGELFIPFPEGKPLTHFSFHCYAEGFTPYDAKWDNMKNEPVPSEFAVTLEPAETIGGIVVDESGRPVEGVEVNTSTEWGKHQRIVLRNYYCNLPAKTDAEGRWRCTMLPKENIGDRADIRLEREGYANTRIGQGLYLEYKANAAGEFPMRLTIEKGITVQGKVVDESGKPIAGALVFTNLVSNSALDSENKTKTDENGEFRFERCLSNVGQSYLGAVDADFGPEMVTPIDLSPNAPPITLTLKPGHPVTFRVIDREDKGIPGATIAMRKWKGISTGAWFFDIPVNSGKTSENGELVWKNAPLDGFEVSCEKGGYMYGSHRSIVADQKEFIFTLRRPVKIACTTVDAETGKPIPEFRLDSGFTFKDESGVENPDQKVFWDGHNTVVGKDGKAEWSQKGENGGFDKVMLRARADGYAEAISEPIPPGVDAYAVKFEMKRPSDNDPDLLGGVVLTPDGKPAAGAVIGVATSSRHVSIENGYSMYDPPATTDAEGKFRISKRGTGINDQDYKLVALHDSGFVKIVKADFEKQKEPLRLVPWGRIEGTLRVGNKPGQQIPVGLACDPREEDFSNRKPYLQLSYLQNMSDENGKFVFDRVFPGKGSVAQLFEKRDIGGIIYTWRYEKKVPYNIEPGETLRIDVGGGGRPVTGKVAVPAGSPDASKLRLVYVEAKLRTPKEFDFGKDREKLLNFYAEPLKRLHERYPGWAAEVDELEKEIRDWEKSPAGQAAIAKDPGQYEKSREAMGQHIAYEKSSALSEQSARYAMAGNNGWFRIDDVPPGDWTITAILDNGEKDGAYKPPTQSSKALTVPAGPFDEPVDAGLIELKEQPPTEPTATRDVITHRQQADGDSKDSEKTVPMASATDTKTEGDVTTFALTILDEAGRPIPHAKLLFGGMPAPLASEEKMENYGMGKAEADENGRFSMSFPIKKLADIRSLFFWIDTPGYAPYNGFWDRPEADPIPSEFSVKLEKGTTIGGVVQNVEGKPVAGAKVTVYIPWENRCRGETNSNIHFHEIETDENGQWKYESYPVSLLGKDEPELLRINHDDYMSTEIYPKYSEYLQNAEGRFTKVSVLEAGIPVKGRVTDENGKPIADALVVGDYRSTMETARLKTNENGEFLIRNWPEHKDNLGKNSSYLAVRKPGYKTALESFDISRNAPPVVDFTLKPIGKPIKIKIIDKDGKPVPGVMIGIEQWKKSRLIALDMLTGKENQFARTDQNGQWTWVEAPDDEVIFDMFDGKHMDLRQVPLKAQGEEYVFTVVPGLKISGEVLDAETGQAIPEFQVYRGGGWKEDSPIAFERVPNVGGDGRYRIDETYPQLYFQVKIEAEGYEPSTSRKILSDEGAIIVDFKLKKSL